MTNPWSTALGPVFTESGLTRRGMQVTEDLITLLTNDGHTIYPNAQFTIQGDGSLRRREAAIRVWNLLIRPAIAEGIVDEWTASGLLLQSTVDEPSNAEVIELNPDKEADIGQSIEYTLERFRH